ncbi:MAG: site-2 protease family protein [Armatimonadota bacterium]|nr:MAG: site-2 protease family protein [Armatimonadota bacterium]
MSIVLTVALFALIIVFHEFGHFVAAKLARIPVYEFALGWGRPVLLSFKWRGTQYSLRPIPVGGYVRIAGMEPEEDVPDGFDKKPVFSRLAVIASGSGMNFVLAIILFWVMGVVFGTVVGHTTEIRRVMPGTPAAAIGLQPRDVLIHAEPVALVEKMPEVMPVATPPKKMKLDDLREVISERPDMPIRLVTQRGDTYLAYRIVPRPEEEEGLEELPNGKTRIVTRTVGLIGVVFVPITEPKGFIESVADGFTEVYFTTKTMVMALAWMIIGKLPAAVGGPVRIADIMADALAVGWGPFLLWSALISVNIGVINLLPIPALDGARIVFILIGGVRRRPIDKRKEAIVHFVGFALLLLFLALVTFKDVIVLIEKRFG